MVGGFNLCLANAGDLVKDLRMARREHKGMKDAIDEAIFAIRIAKKQEVEATLSSLSGLVNMNLLSSL